MAAKTIWGRRQSSGWHRIRPTKEAMSDPVLSVIGEEFHAFQWHQDTFTLPADAVRLARNATTANQCFRIGRASYGMQFHFEASRDVVEAWNDFPDTVERIRPGWLADYPRLAAEHGPQADAAGLALARAWVSLI